MATLQAAAHHALDRGLQYLRAAQDESGCWTDFFLPAGTSDAWVTAFAGLALADRHPEHAESAARWLLRHAGASGGWGYNGTVAADADSTAFAVLLLSRLALPVPSAAVQFLWRHYRTGQGFCTYAFDDPEHRWTRPCADVTASSIAALYAVREIDQSGVAIYFRDLLESHQQPDGFWTGYWWEQSSYPTSLVLDVWAAAGKPQLNYRPMLEPCASAFDTAARLLIAAQLNDKGKASCLASDLLARQQVEGAWPGDARLRVEPSHPNRDPFQQTRMTVDRRRIFTTAQAARALTRALPLLETRSAFPIRTGRATAPVHTIPIAALHPGASPLFECIARDTFDGRTDWPAPQLSSLSGGVPVEFSASVSALPARSEVRYTVDPGEVQAPPYRRALSALEVARQAVDLLGYRPAWDRLQPATNLLLEKARIAPPASRFLIWIGADHNAAQPPILKLYFHLFANTGLDEIAHAAGLPVSPATIDIVHLLNQHGFAQELGFGLGPNGSTGIKIYWELPGWRRSLVDSILRIAGFNAPAAALCPEIPMLLRESLAAKSRAGISLRLDSKSGDIAAITTAAEFIQHMLPAQVTADRVDRWIALNGWNSEPHRRLFNTLAQFGDPAHTLFTRTVSRERRTHATIYLRPPLAALAGYAKSKDTNGKYLAHKSIDEIKETTYS